MDTQNQTTSSDLVGDFSSIKPPETSFQVIALDLIDDPARPVRSDLTPQSVEDLIVSIRQVGIIEPLVVKPKDNRFEVIAGHRRLVAASAANLVEVPCYVVHASDEQGELLKLHENLYRADVRPSDEAEHFRYLIEHYKISPVKVAQLIGKSPSYVTDRLAIFNYPEQLRNALDRKQIKFSVAREFARMEDKDKMLEYLFYSIRNGITQELAKKWVQDWRRSTETPQISEEQSFNPGTQTQVIEHFAKCIYCKEKLNLSQANVVYIHDHCLKEVNTPETDQG